MSVESAAVSEEPISSAAAASEATAVGATFNRSVSEFLPAVRTRAATGAGEAEAKDGMEAVAEEGVDVGVEAGVVEGIVTVGTVFPITVCRFRTRKCLAPRTWAANASALPQVTSHSWQQSRFAAELAFCFLLCFCPFRWSAYG